MYCVHNFKTKAAVKKAVKEGKEVPVYQPNADLFGSGESQRDGRITLEGPHYPEPHRWYAQATIKDGIIVTIK